MKLGRRGMAVLAVAVATIAALAWWEMPRFHGQGSIMVRHEPLAPLGAEVIAIGPGSRIIVLGDSNSQGSLGSAFPSQLQSRFGDAITVINSSRGGRTAADGLARWDISSPADLCILMYGTNDAAPRGWLRSKQAVPLPDYRASLAALGERCRAAGARVLILAPPPSGTRAIESRVARYRLAAREAAQDQGFAFRDPMEAFAGAADKQALLDVDALHLNAVAHALLADWLAALIVVEESRQSAP